MTKTSHSNDDETLLTATDSSNAPSGNAGENAAAANSAAFSNYNDFTGITITDDLFSYQWHLYGAFGILADRVWSSFTGDGITIAFFDSGIQPDHPDLAVNFDAAHQLNAGTGAANGAPGQPYGLDQAHGTWMAGLAAADRNGMGVVGVAYDATIVSIRDGYLNAAPTYDAAATLVAWTYAAAFDIVNNSWGGAPIFSDDFRDPSGYGPAGDAQATAAASGRGGLGTVFVQAAANLRQSGDNVNLHSVTNSIHSITVAATDSAGQVASFSTPGAAILVAAPGVSLATTDLTGDRGVAGTDYALVSGTSGSAALVSGVVALMLDANPNLGWRDVQEILALSARNTDIGTTTTTWQTNGAKIWNGGGFRVSNDLGMGLVDAHAAVRLAFWWPATAAPATSANELHVSTQASYNAVIPDNNTTGVSRSLTITDPITVDHVVVHLDITHPHINDLRVVLRSPSGTESILVQRPEVTTAADEPGGIDFVMSSTQSWGESGAGTWTVTVTDLAAGNVGRWYGWSLTLQGDTPTEDSVYVYTDEFGALGTPGSSRTLLTDDSGDDILLAPSVTTAMILDLRPGAVSTIAGRSLTIGATTIIERAVTGDGDDMVTGNDANNELNGGFGNDTLYGLAGNDTLYGHDGADVMVGGLGNDFYGVDSVDDDVVEELNAGTDRVKSSISYRLPTYVENLTLIGSDAREGHGTVYNNVIVGSLASNLLYGYGGNDSIQGGSGHDTIDGGPGQDTMLGGAGRDVFIVDDPMDVVIEVGGTDTDTIWTSVTYVLPSAVENMLLTQGANIDGIGNSLANRLDGNSGNNFLDGRAGNDTLIGNAGRDTLDGGSGVDRLVGGYGDDVYIVDNVDDFAYDIANGGHDRVEASASHSLTSEIEDLLLLDGAVEGTGNALANQITGNNGDNILTGAAGSDTLTGGGGNDTIYGDHGAGNAFGDDLVRGGTGNDSVLGDAGNDSLFGEDGNDVLIGGAGNDSVVGANGNDTLYGDDTGDSIGDDVVYGGVGDDSIRGGGGNDTLRGDAGDDTLVGGRGDDSVDGGDGNDVIYGDADYEIDSSGHGNDTLLGGDGVDSIFGSGGDDSLRGGFGDDSIAGRFGNDTLQGDAGNDTLDAGDGNDSLWGGLGNDSLDGGGGDDTLDGTSGDDWLFGGVGNDSVFGSIGNDTLLGDAGNDTLNASDGNDSLNGSDGDDTLIGAHGADTLRGGNDNDVLDGGPDNDWLLGGNGNDTLQGGGENDDLIGGAGNDLFIGGTGKDAFVINQLTDGIRETDTIADYSLADGDVISLPNGVISVVAAAADAAGWRLTLAGDGDVIVLLGVVDTAGDGILNDLLFS